MTYLNTFIYRLLSNLLKILLILKNLTQIQFLHLFLQTVEFKSTYIKAIQKRYFMASKKEKFAILTEFFNITGY